MAGQYCKRPAHILPPPGSVAAQGWLGKSRAGSPGETWGLRKREPSRRWELCLNGGSPTGPCSSYNLRGIPSSVCAQPDLDPGLVFQPGLSMAQGAAWGWGLPTGFPAQQCYWHGNCTAFSELCMTFPKDNWWYLIGQHKTFTMLGSIFSPVYQTTREFTALSFYSNTHQKDQVLFTAI